MKGRQYRTYENFSEGFPLGPFDIMYECNYRLNIYNVTTYWSHLWRILTGAGPGAGQAVVRGAARPGPLQAQHGNIRTSADKTFISRTR